MQPDHRAPQGSIGHLGSRALRFAVESGIALPRLSVDKREGCLRGMRVDSRIELVVPLDIAKRLGITNQRVAQLAGRDDFPQP